MPVAFGEAEEPLFQFQRSAAEFWNDRSGVMLYSAKTRRSRPMFEDRVLGASVAGIMLLFGGIISMLLFGGSPPPMQPAATS